MRLFIMAFVALLVLGGGGGAAYYYFSQTAEAAAGDEVGAQHDKNREQVKAEINRKNFEYVELDPLILPIVDQNGVSQVVSLVIALEVPDAAAAEKVKKLTPKLKDAFIQDMYGMLNRHAALKGGVVQVSYLKARLNKVSANVMGDGVIQDVLLQVVQQRPV